LLLGVVGVLYGIIRTVLCKSYTAGIWFAGIGTFLVVVSLFWVAGYNGTAYYPSLTSPESSLTIRNSSSSMFTLTCMTYVSFIIPFVLAYIAYVWRSMDKKKLTPKELEHTDHKY
jgi:cytochrome d ubiquinol oxidase subunit II